MISTIFIYIFTPILAYLAQLNYCTLFATLCLANPFSFMLLLSSLYLLDSNQSRWRPNRILSNGCDETSQTPEGGCEFSIKEASRRSQCCSRLYDQIYLHYKHWIVSVHLTFIFSLIINILPTLKVSLEEVTILYILYGTLTLCILYLKQYNTLISKIRSNNLSTAVLTSGNCQTEVNSMQNHKSVENAICDQICYLKLLANPMQLPVRTTKSNLIETMDIEDQKKPNPNLALNDDLDPVIKSSSFSRKLSPVNLGPNSAIFLITCNIIHILILAQITYLNLTYACLCSLTGFGTTLLIPEDCSDIYQENDKRFAMFNALYSAQLMLCHLIFMFRPARITLF